VNAHGGFEVKSVGDDFMVAFQSAGKALACAAAIKRALLARNDGATEPVKVRMGLHAGEVIKEGELLRPERDHGRARRLAGKRRRDIDVGRGEGAAVGVRRFVGSASRTVELKGLSGEHEIWAVRWKSRVDCGG
jgi:eukaryotic-like serine/threonine-protein kinase